MTITFRFLGISAFEIGETTKKIKILTDPCISKNILCPITIDDIMDVDIILVTHGAVDHMGDAIELQQKTDSYLVCGSDVGVHAKNKGVKKERIVPMIWGDEVEVCGIKIKCLECKHISLFHSKTVQPWLTGIPVSFLIHLEGARIYHVGDTAIFSDLKLFGDLYRPNIALIPVSGSLRVTGGYGHLPPFEAALATQWIGAEIAIPTHYDPEQFEDVSSYAEYVKLLAPSVRVTIMEPGEEVSYNPETHQLS